MAVVPAMINELVVNVLFDSGASENFTEYKPVKNLKPATKLLCGESSFVNYQDNQDIIHINRECKTFA